MPTQSGILVSRKASEMCVEQPSRAWTPGTLMRCLARAVTVNSAMLMELKFLRFNREDRMKPLLLQHQQGGGVGLSHTRYHACSCTNVLT